MKGCDEVQRVLTLGAAAESGSQIEDHLAVCSECRIVAEDLQVLEELARELGQEHQVPPEFGETVLRGSVRGGFFRWGFFHSLALHSALPLLLLTLLAAYVGNDSRPGVGLGVAKTQGEPVILSLEPVEMESGYIDVIVEDPAEGEYILRLPSLIEVHQANWSDDFYIDDVSH